MFRFGTEAYCGEQKKTGIGAVFLIMLIFTACGRENTANTITEMNRDNTASGMAADAYGNNYSNSSGKSSDMQPGDISTFNEKADDVFRHGTWFCVKGDAALAYLSFDTDGKTGELYNLVDGEPKEYTYSVIDNTVSISGDFEELFSDNMEQLDEDTIVLNPQSDEQVVLTYVSDKNSEEFTFYTVEQLLEMAREYQKKNEGYESVGATYTDNADMTVTIQLTTDNGEQVITDASYTVDRITAEGRNDLSGTEIDLKQ